MDDEERRALLAEGLDPDNPAHLAAVDLVAWELSLFNPRRGIPRRPSGGRKPATAGRVDRRGCTRVGGSVSRGCHNSRRIAADGRGGLRTKVAGERGFRRRGRIAADGFYRIQYPRGSGERGAVGHRRTPAPQASGTRQPLNQLRDRRSAAATARSDQVETLLEQFIELVDRASLQQHVPVGAGRLHLFRLGQVTFDQPLVSSPLKVFLAPSALNNVAAGDVVPGHAGGPTVHDTGIRTAPRLKSAP
jgi:hypothetical protein